jgi:hypothetical protein
LKWKFAFPFFLGYFGDIQNDNLGQLQGKMQGSGSAVAVPNLDSAQ